MPKHHIALSEIDIAKIINGGEVHFEFKGETYIVRQSYAKDIVKDMLVRDKVIRKNIDMIAESSTF